MDNYLYENETFEFESLKFKDINLNETAFAIFSKIELISIVIAYLMVFILSVIGNTIILIVICRKKRMRTANNYFLANIIVSNLIYTLCAPFPFIIEISERNGEWIYPDFMCPILPFINTLSVNLNTLTMTASSLDRLISIVSPFKRKLSKRKCICIIVNIWILSIIFSLPWALLMRIQLDKFFLFEQVRFTNTSIVHTEPVKICFPLERFGQILRYYFCSLNIIQYILPLSSLVITYSIITYYVNIINAKRMGRDVNKTNNKLRRKNEKKLFKMHILMLICFNACWLPFQLNAFLFVVDPLYFSNKASPFIAKVSWMASHWFAFCHFCLNPYLTGFLNINFRKQIKGLIFRGNSTDRNQLVSTCKKSNQINNTIIINFNKKYKYSSDKLEIKLAERKLSSPTPLSMNQFLKLRVNYCKGKENCSIF